MKQILIIDDDLLSTDFLRLHLSRAGFHVTVANSLNAAMASLQTAVPDAVITDLQLKDGSGISIASFARERGCQVVIGMSGYDSDYFAQRGMTLKAFSVLLSKPISLDEIDRLLGEHFGLIAAGSVGGNKSKA